MILTLLFAIGLSASEPSRQLLAVELVRETPEAVIRLVGDGPLRYSTLHLDEPPRVILDLEGVIVHSPWPKLALAGGPVRRVRVAQLQVLPEPVTRVVFDLERWTLPVVEPASDGLLVTFEPAPPRPPPPAPPAPPRAPPDDVVLPDPALPPIVPPRVSAPPPALPPPVEPAPEPTPAPPEAPPAEPADAPRIARSGGRLIATLQLDDLAPGDGGGGASIDWLRPLSARATLLAGASRFELDDARWAFGKLGALVRPGTRSILRVELHGGGGERADGTAFDYRIGQAELVWELRPKRLYLRLEDRYVDVDRTAGNLLGAGFTALPRPWLSTTISYLRSTGGRSLDSEFVTGRIDGTSGRIRFFGGVARGRSQPTAVGIIGIPGAMEPGTMELEQIYSGITAMLRGAELTVVLDRLDFEVAERTTLSLSLSVPLGRREPAAP